MKSRILDWCIVLIGIAGLIFVRVIEDRAFYDPFILYFKSANQQLSVPDFELPKLIFSHILRFALNLFFSLIVIQFIFKNIEWTKQAFILIVLAFSITFPIYLYCITTDLKLGYLLTFYMRRFVIQPLILLLIIPMFYYRRKTVARS